jgi:3-isopropylmalate/(R)-2-methylmalate dehydratase small subunit
MEKFVTYTGVVAPLNRVNVDTDQIIPKVFLKSISRTGYGVNCFNDWRYLEDGSLNPDFVLNRPEYQGASVLLAGRNFGCGSSREHAPWALQEMGFKAIIAPSFADIFHQNCLQNGVVPVVLPEEQIEQLFQRAEEEAGCSITVDLERQVVEADGFSASFEIDPFRKHLLLNGLDDIGLTLQKEDAVAAYEARRPAWMPKVEVPV